MINRLSVAVTKAAAIWMRAIVEDCTVDLRRTLAMVSLGRQPSLMKPGDVYRLEGVLELKLA